MAGKWPKECHRCHDFGANYHEHFNTQFSSFLPEIKKKTGWDGSTSFLPVSFDYRMTNLCNFKCRMCQSDYSSAWRSETISHDGDYSLDKWLRISKYRNHTHELRSILEPEILKSIEDRTLAEVYWAGGEPLLMDIHWDIMKKIVSAGIAERVRVTYNTNLSRLEYRGKHLWHDILKHFPNYGIGLSLDATGAIGEYIRTGLVWDKWYRNLETIAYHSESFDESVRIALTMTLPGILDLKNLLDLAARFNLRVSANIVRTFGANQRLGPLSPLALPANELGILIDETLTELASLRTDRNEPVFNLLETLRNTRTWADELSELQYRDRISSGIADVLELEQRRPDVSLTFKDILAPKTYLVDWFERYAPRN